MAPTSHPPPPPNPTEFLKALVSSATGVMAVLSLAGVIAGGAWYLSKQEGGGKPTSDLAAAIAAMDARIGGRLAAAEKLRDADSQDLRQIARDVAALQATQERLRAETEAERRMRDGELQRILAEAAWLRQQLIELRASPRRQNDDGGQSPEDFAPPGRTDLELREAAAPVLRSPLARPN